MKKFFLLIISLLLITAFSLAQQGSGLEGKVIVIDPGHGGYGPNDRQMPIPDISVPGQNDTYFWESWGNWNKANYLKPMLETLGATVILTREHNDYPDGQPGLGARYEVANSNNADWFHSIHSNGGGAQYTAVFIRENIPGEPNNTGTGDRLAAFPEAPIMGRMMAQYLLKHLYVTSIWNANGQAGQPYPGVALDYTFYGGPTNGGYNLGVMRGALMPCELSEGSFHDYEPETRRLMNPEYKKNEAYALRNAMMEYYGVPADPLCIVMGSVTDASIRRNVNFVNIKLDGPDVSKTYTGDKYFNGYYFFDELPAGDYTLTFETEGYPTQSIPFTLTTGQVRFVEISTQNAIPPTVSTTLVEGNTTTPMTSTFTFTFSKVMNRTSVQNAVSLTPATACSFAWSNNDMTLVVRPTMPLRSETAYTITIDGSAADIGGITIEQPLIRNFTTRPASEELPIVIANHPLTTSRNFPTIGTINIAFNREMDTASLQTAISMRRGTTTLERLLHFDIVDEKTVVTIKPVEPLQPNNAAHIVIISTQAKDATGIAISAQYQFTFYTAYDSYNNITTIESFADGVGDWWIPTGSGSTTGVEVNKTTMALDNTIYYPYADNQRSMRLNYGFLPNTANLIREYLSGGAARNVVVPVTPTTILQSFVFGDGSNNRIRFCLDDGPTLGLHKVSNWVTINWYGWRLLQWNFNDPNQIGSWLDAGVAEGPTVRFDSYQIQHDVDDNDNLEGTIWFDELRFINDNLISLPDLLPTNIPTEFSLEQNYPNPFNPSTNLHFNISEASKIKLVIYDLLGREVSVLKDEIMNPGIYKVTWDATDLPSGVYFAKLFSGSNISTIKMMLAK